jgi:hypothetical protein
LSLIRLLGFGVRDFGCVRCLRIFRLRVISD